MTVSECAKLIGQVGSIYHNGLRVKVKVLDVKVSYGIVRYLVAPIAGTGQAWYNCDSVYLGEQP